MRSYSKKKVRVSGSRSDSDQPRAVDSTNLKLSKSVGFSRHEKKAKMSKTETSNPGLHEEGKKSPFRRIWTSEDEIALLKGFIKFQQEGMNASDYTAEFYESNKESLSASMSQTQVRDKVRKMKNKYLVNAHRNSKDPLFSEHPAREIFKLSTKILEGGGGAEGSIRRKNPPRKAVPEKEAAPRIKSKAKGKSTMQKNL